MRSYVKLISSGFIFVVLFAFTVPAQEAQRNKPDDSDPMSVVEIEREFAKTSVTKGIREAFLTFLADDAVVYRNGWVNGIEANRKRSVTKDLLTWYPVFADVSMAGDLGYSTGPYEYRENPSAKIADIYGTFLTIWKRQPDGAWKAVLDRGIFHSPPSENLSLNLPPADSRPKKLKYVNPQTERTKLLDLDKKFSAEILNKGEAKALPVFADTSIRLYRENQFTFVGIEAAKRAMVIKPGLISFEPLFADVSRSGDLGYLYGNYVIKGGDSGAKVAEEGSYVRIWKKQSNGKWKVVVDLIRSKQKAG